jgi:methionyl-tRNA synthetase
MLNFRGNKTIPTLETRHLSRVVNAKCANERAGIIFHLKEFQFMYLLDICMGHYSNFNFYKAVDRLIATLHQANLFFETLKPWELKKQPSKRRELDSVLHLTLETLRVCGILLQPIIPNISSNLLNKINVPRERRHFSDAKQLSWDNSNFIGKELSGDKSVLFKRIVLKDDEKKRVRS